MSERRPGLVVTDLSVHFGGNKAVQNISLQAPVGLVTGLIGPNGAGKTTTFNACSGFLSPTSGRVELFGREATRDSTARRARAGLGRTFQRMELFDSLTVRENVALGCEAGLGGSSPLGQLISTRAERARVRAATEEALELTSIDVFAERRVGALSTGQRRLVDMARCLAGGFSLLLLDEPSSGLDHEETVRFGEVIERVMRDRDVGVLLVEHDIELVMGVCDYMFVLDFGQLVFQGTPAEVRASPVVRAAYLGEAA
jgi:ABC-type branched-subunit amino acid transport system ATPase component